MLAPPRPPSPDQLEALIREARARQRKRRIAAAAVIALVAGVAVAACSIASHQSSRASRTGSPTAPARITRECGIRVAGPKILGSDGRAIYREPIRHEVNPNRIPSQVRCSGATVWVVFFNGAASSQEAYFGVHSNDGGRTWRPVFTERYFGLKAPHALDAYLGPWTLSRGAAYFVGLCPACDPQPTVSLWVTRDGGRTIRSYDITALDGYWPKAIRVAGAKVTISADRLGRRRTATVHVS